MRVNIFLLVNSVALWLSSLSINAQSISLQWEKSVGGTSGDYAYAIVQNNDGSYLVAGDSYSTDDDVSDHHGTNAYADGWLAKIDSGGQILWAKSYGGTNSDGFFNVKSTSDGGYIAAGYSYSDDGDVSGHHGTTSYSDFWIVKIDGNGNLVWEKSLGGSDDEKAESILPSAQGGYVAVGYTKSSDGDVKGNHGAADYWIVILDTDGNLKEQHCFGGSTLDWAKDVVQTPEGDYFIAGYSDSDDGQVSDHHGSAGIGDFWVVKLNSSGKKIWQKSYGGTNTDQAQSVQLASDGDILIAGETMSVDGDVNGIHGGKDFWLLKIDGDGAIVWQQCYGGENDERAYSINQTNDNGFIIAGDSFSNDGQVSGHHGSSSFSDYWVIKVDSTGTLLWENSFGGDDDDNAYAVCQTSNGGYAVTGWCNSNNGDITDHYGGNVSDYWIAKLKYNTVTNLNEEGIRNSSFSLFPNPSHGNVAIAALLPNQESVTISILDLAGKQLYSENIGNSIGKFSRQLDLKNFSSGTYLVQIFHDSQKEVKKLVLQK